jgi:hypothetical protein
MWVWVAFAMLLMLPTAVSAQTEKRIALLIGNQAYNTKVGSLKNPHIDIGLIGTALRSLKFEVTEVKDADYRAIDTSINKHIQKVRRGGEGTISLVYYSGHGAANPETKINYLIPVDVANADDEELWTNSVNLNKIIESLREQAPTATHYVVFDACRNELNLTLKGRRALADRGFLPIGYMPSVLIAYATAPGKTASDAGIYARALSEEIVKPGLEAVTMFRRVALRVNREIGQDPWLAASTLPEHYLAGSKSEEQVQWESVRSSKDPRVLETYLSRYPNGEYAAVVTALIEQHEHQLKAEEAAQEQERKREDVERKATEVQRLEQELRAREAKLVEWLRLMDQGQKTNADTQQLQEKQAAENKARAEELRKAREEARLAREAAKAAEEQRLAAAKTADDAKVAAEISKAKVAAINTAELKKQHVAAAALPNPLSDEAATRIKSLIQRHGFPMPTIEFQTPSDDVAAYLRRFVGLWIEPTGRGGTARKLLIMITRVDKDGRVHVIRTTGPPGSESWTQAPPRIFETVTRIVNEKIMYTAFGVRERLEMNADGNLSLFSVNTDGRTRSEVLSRVWGLAEAKSSAGPPERK